MLFVCRALFGVGAGIILVLVIGVVVVLRYKCQAAPANDPRYVKMKRYVFYDFHLYYMCVLVWAKIEDVRLLCRGKYIMDESQELVLSAKIFFTVYEYGLKFFK